MGSVGGSAEKKQVSQIRKLAQESDEILSRFNTLSNGKKNGDTITLSDGSTMT